MIRLIMVDQMRNWQWDKRLTGVYNWKGENWKKTLTHREIIGVWKRRRRRRARYHKQVTMVKVAKRPWNLEGRLFDRPLSGPWKEVYPRTCSWCFFYLSCSFFLTENNASQATAIRPFFCSTLSSGNVNFPFSFSRFSDKSPCRDVSRHRDITVDRSHFQPWVLCIIMTFVIYINRHINNF